MARPSPLATPADENIRHNDPDIFTVKGLIMSKISPLDYRSQKPVWCAGCGDFNVLSCLYQALSRLEIPPHRLVVVSGIGCSSRLPYFLKSYGFHSVHGRALPIAQGVKAANPDLTVLVVGGDGDGLGIGSGHLVNAARRNPDLTYLMLDNNLYGQTKGQASPTTARETRTATTPFGGLEEPLDPVLLAQAAGACFVGRGLAAPAGAEMLIDLMVQAIAHRGFSLVHVLSPCPTFGSRDIYKATVSRAVPIPADHSPEDRRKAMNLALPAEKLYLGLFYRVRRPTLEETLATQREASLKKSDGHG